ncbi:restriction endonuclease subunit S [Raoultella ornithinolytica]|uniref:restriction endonuclease subunit S n=1 Tax=Raoultella ornithinolytica TaxID=54291 RepID=UPI0015DC3385|nr:restriction endonuclease subunit S [Raoultella ornithinolytica]MCW9581661.1 restriction endonuclease subunit S [Raoultella ornithinolytica]QLK18475.1 restriction endonuclease subunit S [Raoultella ornithinolytica]BBQ91642.1 type I restriction endonuclease EcoprrI subunit S [Raoultella ornithinolytica]
MSELTYLEKLLDGAEVEWFSVNDVFDIFAGGDIPKDSLSDIQTDEYNIPIYSNGIGSRALYGWTNKAKIDAPSLTISARGTIGWTSYQENPFFPVVRLLVLTPKIQLNLKYSYYFMKMIEGDYKVPKTGIPQLTKPMIKDIKLPIPCPDNPEKSLAIQSEIVRILDTFTALTAELTAELSMRKKQYNYYRDQLLSFNDGEVECKTLGEIIQMRAGQHISTSKIMERREDDYVYPCFGGNGIRGYVKQKSHDGEHLLIGRQGALCGNVKRMKGQFYATEHAVVVSALPGINIDWAFHMLTAMNLNQYASKSAQPGLAVGKLQELKLPVPSIKRQEYIASILDKFDMLTDSITEGLPREIELRQKQYEYYRDMLFSFPKPEVAEA